MLVMVRCRISSNRPTSSAPYKANYTGMALAMRNLVPRSGNMHKGMLHFKYATKYFGAIKCVRGEDDLHRCQLCVACQNITLRIYGSLIHMRKRNYGLVTLFRW
jgi:hypothetical protein